MSEGVSRGSWGQRWLSAWFLLLLICCADALTIDRKPEEASIELGEGEASGEDSDMPLTRSFPPSYKLAYSLSLVLVLLLFACLVGGINRCCRHSVIVERRPVVLMLLRASEGQDLPAGGRCVEEDSPPPYCDLQADDLPPPYSEVCKDT